MAPTDWLIIAVVLVVILGLAVLGLGPDQEY